MLDQTTFKKWNKCCQRELIYKHSNIQTFKHTGYCIFNCNADLYCKQWRKFLIVVSSKILFLCKKHYFSAFIECQLIGSLFFCASTYMTKMTYLFSCFGEAQLCFHVFYPSAIIHYTLMCTVKMLYGCNKFS